MWCRERVLQVPVGDLTPDYNREYRKKDATIECAAPITARYISRTRILFLRRSSLPNFRSRSIGRPAVPCTDLQETFRTVVSGC